MQRAFACVLREYGGLISRVAASYEADPALREDLLQDIALALWRALPAWQGNASIKTFVARIAHNRGASHVADQTRRKPPIDLSEDLPDPARRPDAHAELQQDLARLQRAVRSLPLNLRQTMTLAFEGFSHQEIGETLGINTNNVDVRLHRARKALTRLLGEPA